MEAEVTSTTAEGTAMATNCPKPAPSEKTESILQHTARVADEFIRLYFQFLEERPNSLHRFFLQDSRFKRGGVEKPNAPNRSCQGQLEIHQEISKLGFKNCHSRILRKDAMPFLDGGATIQVMGELSNNGGRDIWRPFFQTFVLKRKSALEFYVLNTVFTYLDDEPGEQVFPVSPKANGGQNDQ